MAEVSKTGDAVGRGSWRSSFLGAPGAELFAGNFSAQKFLETGRRRPVPRFPVASGRPKENSSYGKCAQENCLTLGVHPTRLCLCIRSSALSRAFFSLFCGVTHTSTFASRERGQGRTA